MLRHLGVAITLPAPVAHMGGHIVNADEAPPGAMVFTNAPAAKSPELTKVAPISVHVWLLFVVHCHPAVYAMIKFKQEDWHAGGS